MTKIFTPFTKPDSDEAWLKEKNPGALLDPDDRYTYTHISSEVIENNNKLYNQFEQTALSNARVIINPCEGKEEYLEREITIQWYLKEKRTDIKFFPERVEECLVWDGSDKELEKLKVQFKHLDFFQAYEYIVKEERAKEEEAPPLVSGEGKESVEEAASTYCTYTDKRANAVAHNGFKAGASFERERILGLIEERIAYYQKDPHSWSGVMIGELEHLKTLI